MMTNLSKLLIPKIWSIEPIAFSSAIKQIEAWALKDEPPSGELPDYSVEVDDHGIAHISLHGIMMRAPGLLDSLLIGAFDTREAQAAIENAVADPSVRAICLDVDSPGGEVDGVYELADLVAAARFHKPIVAFSSGQMCSAAYWVASQADEVWATRGAQVGSIGALMTFLDSKEALAKEGLKVEVITSSNLKATGIPGTSLTEEQKAYLYEQVREVFRDFQHAVASRLQVSDEAFSGKVWLGKHAETLGLVRIAKNKTEVLSRIVDKLSNYRMDTETLSPSETTPSPQEQSPKLQENLEKLETELLAALEENEKLHKELDETTQRLKGLEEKLSAIEREDREIEARVERRIASLLASSAIAPVPAKPSASSIRTQQELHAEFEAIRSPQERAKWFRSLSEQERREFMRRS